MLFRSEGLGVYPREVFVVDSGGSGKGNVFNLVVGPEDNVVGPIPPWCGVVSLELSGAEGFAGYGFVDDDEVPVKIKPVVEGLGGRGSKVGSHDGC